MCNVLILINQCTYIPTPYTTGEPLNEDIMHADVTINILRQQDILEDLVEMLALHSPMHGIL